jgi:hypothetical protein
MPEVCRKEYDRTNSDLLDEHDKWFRNLGFDQKPEKYPEWYNAWMDSKYGLYVLYVADMSVQPYQISSSLQLNPLPESLKEWCTSKGKTIPTWESLILFVLGVKGKLISLRNRQDLIMGNIKSLTCGLASFHMMKTTYTTQGRQRLHKSGNLKSFQGPVLKCRGSRKHLSCFLFK